MLKNVYAISKNIVVIIVIVVLAIAGGVGYYLYSLQKGAPTSQEPPALARLPPGPEKEMVKQWLQAAFKEGTAIYRTNVIDPVEHEMLLEEFHKFIGADNVSVQIEVLKSGPLVTKTEEELAAGKLGCDMIYSALVPWFKELINRTELLQWDNPNEKYFDPKYVEHGYWIADIAYYGIFDYNTEVIKKEIKSYWDVIDPAFKGLISVTDITQSLTAAQKYVALRETRAVPLQFWIELAKLNPVYILGGGDRESKVVSGECPINLDAYTWYAVRSVRKGAPVKVIYPIEGVIVQKMPWVILAKAPHPNVAKLWIYFLTSEVEIYTKAFACASAKIGWQSPYPDILASPNEVKILDYDMDNIPSSLIDKYRQEWQTYVARGA